MISAELRPETPIAPAEVPTFYSPTERALEARMPKQAPVSQVMGILKSSGVPPDEAKWMDVEGFLAGKDKVSKEEVLNYVRAHRVQLEEVRLGERNSSKAPTEEATHYENYRLPGGR